MRVLGLGLELGLELRPKEQLALALNLSQVFLRIQTVWVQIVAPSALREFP